MNLKKSMLFLILTAAIFQSCSGDKEGDVLENAQFTSRETSDFTAAEGVSTDLDNLIDFTLSSELSSASGKEVSAKSAVLPACVTITTVENAGMVSKTVQFTQSCQIGDHAYSGAFILEYESSVNFTSKKIDVTFDAFTVDGIEINGTKSVQWTLSNENGNPQSVFTTDINILWANGLSASFTGGRTREWIEGFASGSWADNVFSIKGEWTLSASTGNVYHAVTTEPLIRKVLCRHIVSGIVKITKNETIEVSIDYGDGNCDNKVVVTLPNGKKAEVTLDK